MQAELLVLRTIHILGGIFWLGSGLFTTFFLLPVLRSAGPATASVIMAGLQRRLLFLLLPTVALLTIASGTRLMWIVSDGFSAVYFNSPGGRVIAWGGVAAIAAFLISLVVSVMRLRRLERIAAISGMAAMALLVAAATAMAVGRYV